LRVSVCFYIRSSVKYFSFRKTRKKAVYLCANILWLYYKCVSLIHLIRRVTTYLQFLSSFLVTFACEKKDVVVHYDVTVFWIKLNLLHSARWWSEFPTDMLISHCAGVLSVFTVSTVVSLLASFIMFNVCTVIHNSQFIMSVWTTFRLIRLR